MRLVRFSDLPAYRAFLDEIVGRANDRNAKRIESERSHLRRLPDRCTCDGTCHFIDFDAVPMISKAQVMAVAAGDA